MAPLIAPTPETLRTTGWSDYALIDSGDGRKLERYGRFTVVRRVSGVGAIKGAMGRD